ncbi:MAG: hypothetical protein JWP89_5965 [Schlesneria sp.]|nr:hypothetical protein [Schlesneria sp.]
MSVNKFLPHVYVIPEDRADEQLANGFVLHDQVNVRQIQVLPCVDGWPGVLDKFRTEYVTYLRNNKDGYVVLLIDFDSDYVNRRDRFDKEIPADLKNRVFVIGAKDTPEILRQELGKNFEEIGLSLAEDCYKGGVTLWGHEHLQHNEPDRVGLIRTVKSILFRK